MSTGMTMPYFHAWEDHGRATVRSWWYSPRGAVPALVLCGGSLGNGWWPNRVYVLKATASGGTSTTASGAVHGAYVSPERLMPHDGVLALLPLQHPLAVYVHENGDEIERHFAELERIAAEEW